MNVFHPAVLPQWAIIITAFCMSCCSCLDGGEWLDSQGKAGDEKNFHVSFHATGTEPSNESMGSLCGENRSLPCASLLHGLRAVERWLSGPGNDTSSWVNVLLVPDTSECEAPFGIPVEREVNYTVTRLARVTIRLPESTNCTYAKLVRSRTSQEPGKNSLLLMDSFAVRIKNIHFVSSDVLLSIKNSSFVHIEDCLFSVDTKRDDMNKRSSLCVLRSHGVFVTGCVFRPLDGNTHGVLPGQVQLETMNSPVFRAIIVPHDDGEHANSTTFNTWRENSSYILVSYEMMKSHRFCGTESSETCHLSNSSVPWQLSLVVHKCHFQNLGYRFILERPFNVNSTMCRGNALNILFGCEAKDLTVIVDECRFENNSHPQNSALMVQFNSDSCWSKTKMTFNNMAYILNSEFRRNTGLIGGAVLLNIANRAFFNVIKLTNNLFELNTAMHLGGALAVYFADEMCTTNCFWAENSTFLNNSLQRKAYHGSGLHVYAARESAGFNQHQMESLLGVDLKEMASQVRRCGSRITVWMDDSVFKRNTGNGAFFARNVDVVFSGQSVMKDNAGTALVVKSATVDFLRGSVSIVNNEGMFAGAIYVGETGRVVIKAANITITGNSAVETGGGLLYADRDSSSPSSDEMLFNVGYSAKTYSKKCPITFNRSLATHTQEQLCLQNSRANRPAIFSASWHDCFGSLNIPNYPSVTGDNATVTESDYCLPYIGPAHDQRNCACSLGSKPPMDMQTYRMAGSMPKLDQPVVCKSGCRGHYVANEANLYRKKIQTHCTWLVFKSTTTTCYREFRGNVDYLRVDCSREKLVDTMRDRVNGNDVLMDCSLYWLAMAYQRYPYSPVLPGYPFVLVPWAGLHWGWWLFLDKELERRAQESGVDVSEMARTMCTFEGNQIPFQSEASVSKITLHPASGEEFNLSIDVFDEMLGLLHKTLQIEVVADMDDVLLGHAGVKYVRHKSLVFPSGRPMQHIAILGPARAYGYILITKQGGNIMRESNSNFLQLRIPFRIRQCHLGFVDPQYNTSERVIQFIEKFTAHHTSDNGTCSHDAHNDSFLNDNTYSPLACQCPESIDPTDNAIHQCQHGRYIRIKRGYWAGPENHDNIPYLTERKSQKNFSTKDFNGHPYNGDPFGNSDHTKFASAQCDNGLCEKTKVWTVGVDDPCITDMHRIGVLCGECQNGTQTMIATEACYSCRNLNYKPLPVSAYVILLFIVTFAMFSLLLILNVGLSPTFDSWLFFIQATFYLLPDQSKLSSAYLSFLTLGLGHVCLDTSMSRLRAKASLLAQPLFLYFFIMLLWLCISCRFMIKYLQQLQRRNTLAHVVWFIVVLSSSNMAYISSTILASVRLSTGKRVLMIDGSVEFFSPGHQWFGVLAIVVLLLLVLPPPLILLVPYLRGLPALRGFVDAALSSYEPHVPWWAAVNLLRRVLLAVLQATLVHGELRCICTTLVGLMLLAVQSLVRPFKRETRFWILSDVDNRFEMLLLACFCCLCIARLCAVREGIHFFHSVKPSDFYVPLYSIPTAMALLLATARFAYSWWGTYQQKRRQQLTPSDFLEDSDEMNRQHGLRLHRQTSERGDSGLGMGGSSAGGTRERSLSNGVHGSLDNCEVPCGLREPLLLHAVMNPDGKQWSEKAV